MAKISVEKWVEIHRRYWLRHEANTPTKVKFGNDPEVKAFIIGYYYYLDWLDGGNQEPISELDYKSWAHMIVDKNDYNYSREGLKETGYTRLYNALGMLRKRYARMSL